MPEDTVEVLVEGGSATPGPPLGPAIGPLGINMMQVVEEINNKTADFKGMKVPVKIIVDDNFPVANESKLLLTVVLKNLKSK